MVHEERAANGREQFPLGMRESFDAAIDGICSGVFPRFAVGLYKSILDLLQWDSFSVTFSDHLIDLSVLDFDFRSERIAVHVTQQAVAHLPCGRTVIQIGQQIH